MAPAFLDSLTSRPYLDVGYSVWILDTESAPAGWRKNLRRRVGMGAAQKRTMRQTRPNILLICTDQMRADMMGCAGHPVVQTPTLDRLAGRGVRLPRAYCSAPVCIPTRVSMFSGLYPHSFGKVAHIRMPIDPRIRMLPAYLADAGYRTGIVGKTHFWPPTETYGAEGAWLTIDSHLSKELGEHDAYKAYLREQGYSDVADESQLPEEHYRTRWTARESAAFIRSEDERPFFLFCSFVKPHPPYDPPEPYASLYADADFPVPVAREEEFTTRPLFVRSRMDRDLVADPARLQGMKAKYGGLVTMLDAAIGDIVSALEETGVLDNTMIVFTSDHGEFLGDHYLRNKTLFYEASAAIPLIMAGPDILEGQVSPALTGHVDLLPTLLDFAGIDLPGRREGESLRPVLTTGNTEGWREAMFGELVVQLRISSEGVWSNNLKMVTTDRHKYCYYSRVLDGEGAEEELFDLHNDPHEFENLAETAEGREICRDMRDRLLEWLARAEEHRLYPVDERYPYSTYVRETGRIEVISPESAGGAQASDKLPF